MFGTTNGMLDELVDDEKNENDYGWRGLEVTDHVSSVPGVSVHDLLTEETYTLTRVILGKVYCT